MAETSRIRTAPSIQSSHKYARYLTKTQGLGGSQLNMRRWRAPFGCGCYFWRFRPVFLENVPSVASDENADHGSKPQRRIWSGRQNAILLAGSPLPLRS